MDNDIVKVWERLADQYGTERGKPVQPHNLADYPNCIMSLLSDAQEAQDRGAAERANANINAAKVMLCRMHDAGREAERAGTHNWEIV